MFHTKIPQPTVWASVSRKNQYCSALFSFSLTSPQPLISLCFKNKRNMRRQTTHFVSLQFWGYYANFWPASWETYMQVRKQQLELDMEQQDWFQIGKGIHQGCILSPCLFNFYAEYIMRNAGLEETQARIKIAGEISITSDMQMTPPLWQKVKRN